MTTLTDKPIRRRVNWGTRGVVVTLYPNGLIGFRIPKTRTEHTVPITTCFQRACQLTGEREKQAKAAEKAQRRADRGLPPLRKLVRRSVL